MTVCPRLPPAFAAAATSLVDEKGLAVNADGFRDLELDEDDAADCAEAALDGEAAAAAEAAEAIALSAASCLRLERIWRPVKDPPGTERIRTLTTLSSSISNCSTNALEAATLGAAAAGADAAGAAAIGTAGGGEGKLNDSSGGIGDRTKVGAGGGLMIRGDGKEDRLLYGGEPIERLESSTENGIGEARAEENG